MYTLEKAYIALMPSFVGFCGFQHFYLNNPLKGVIYFLTLGGFFIGTIYDLVTLETQVREANIRDGFFRNKKLSKKRFEPSHNIEHIILKAASNNKGIVTPSQVALDGNISIENASKVLKELVIKGFAEIKVSTGGVIMYCFPEFMEDLEALDFEDI